jgi:predicted adenylyl cyclase CyaB
MARNLELKARLRDLATARQVAGRLSGGVPQVLEQVDTYFSCRQGRLKLREESGGTAHLVAYARPDESAARLSDYRLVPVNDPAGLKAALIATVGLWGEVRKRRELSLVENVRIHLDQVEGLGEFLEFEAVFQTLGDKERAASQLAALSGQFGIEPADLIAGSYSDLLLPPRADFP